MLRLGSVPYLNARPLLAGLEGLDDLSLTLLPPARLAVELRKGRLDAALVPVLEPLSHPRYRVADGVGIGSDGPVRSVLLYCRVPSGRILSLAGDPDSMTSNALARVLLAERHGLLPTEAPAEKADAIVAIGDRALAGLPGAWAEVLDLGQAWKEQTALPFVYAVWALLPDAPSGTADLLRSAARRGTSDLGALAEGADLDYLRHALRYGLGDREREGISEFARLARHHGLLPPGPPLVWA